MFDCDNSFGPKIYIDEKGIGLIHPSSTSHRHLLCKIGDRSPRNRYARLLLKHLTAKCPSETTRSGPRSTLTKKEFGSMHPLLTSYTFAVQHRETITAKRLCKASVDQSTWNPADYNPDIGLYIWMFLRFILSLFLASCYD